MPPKRRKRGYTVSQDVQEAKKTRQLCTYCGKGFAAAGIGMHIKACEVEHEPEAGMPLVTFPIVVI